MDMLLTSVCELYSHPSSNLLQLENLTSELLNVVSSWLSMLNPELILLKTRMLPYTYLTQFYMITSFPYYMLTSFPYYMLTSFPYYMFAY